MTSDRDPITKAIYGIIVDDIRYNLAGNRLNAATKLIYSGIDTMAYLGMPDKNTQVRDSDFKKWLNRYVSFPECPNKITPTEFWKARCGVLHTTTPFSNDNGCRLIGYCNKSDPQHAIMAHPAAPDLVIVSVDMLADRFVQGVRHFLTDVYSDKYKTATKKTIEERMNRMFQAFNV